MNSIFLYKKLLNEVGLEGVEKFLSILLLNLRSDVSVLREQAVDNIRVRVQARENWQSSYKDADWGARNQSGDIGEFKKKRVIDLNEEFKTADMAESSDLTPAEIDKIMFNIDCMYDHIEREIRILYMELKRRKDYCFDFESISPLVNALVSLERVVGALTKSRSFIDPIFLE